MNPLIVHVINSCRRYTIIDGCQKQCAVEFLHCHLFPSLTKGGFCREYHRFFERPVFSLHHHKAGQYKVRAATSRYGLLFKSNSPVTKKPCDVLFKGTPRTRFSMLACAQKSCVQIGKSTHDRRNNVRSTTGNDSDYLGSAITPLRALVKRIFDVPANLHDCIARVWHLVWTQVFELVLLEKNTLRLRRTINAHVPFSLSRNWGIENNPT